MNETSTAQMMMRDEKELRKRSFEYLMEAFVKQYAPQYPRENSQFHSQLHSLMRQTFQDAQEPLLKHLEAMTSAYSPLIMKAALGGQS